MKDSFQKIKEALIENKEDFLSYGKANGMIPYLKSCKIIQKHLKEIEKESKNTQLKDIDGKSIYADSSIFEFNYIGDDCKKYYFIGWLEVNIEEQRSEINILNDSKVIHLWYKHDKISNIKIVGTIQENKLKLIKDK